MKGIVKDACILFVITLIAGFLLGMVHDITLAPIAAAAEAAATATYQEVYADAVRFSQTDELKAAIEASAEEIASQGYGNVSVDEAREAYDAGDNVIGYLITSTSNDGYNGTIQISLGISNDGTLTGIGFLTIGETPGLGMKADEPDFKSQFPGKPVNIYTLTKSAPGGDDEILAISGASFTSNAVTGAVNAAVYFVQNCIAK